MATERGNDLRAFRDFASEQLSNGGTELTLDQCLGLWENESETDEETKDSIEAVREALDDMRAGDTGVPARGYSRTATQAQLARTFMTYDVRVLRRAWQDLDDITTHIAERSPEGAARLLRRFDDAMEQLEKNPFIAPIASESTELGDDVRYIMFRTKSGRKYRAMFVIVGDEVRVLRVRGPGQPPVQHEDIAT